MSGEDLRLGALGLMAAAVAILGWLYDKRLGLQAAQKRLQMAGDALASKQDNIIATMNQELRFRDLRLEAVEKALEDCQKQWARRRRRDDQEKRRQELIG
jgi:hypothetical protein